MHLGKDNMPLLAFVDSEIPIGKKAQKEKKWRQDFMYLNLAEKNKESQNERREEQQDIIHLTKEKLEKRSMPLMQQEYFLSHQMKIP